MLSAQSGAVLTLTEIQELFRGVAARCQADSLAELIKQIDEEKIREIKEKLLFQSSCHRATSRLLVLTFSRWRCCVLVCCCALLKRCRIVGRFLRFKVTAVNSRKAGSI